MMMMMMAPSKVKTKTLHPPVVQLLPGDTFSTRSREKKEALEHITDHAWKFVRKASVRRRRTKSWRSAEERIWLGGGAGADSSRDLCVHP